MYDFISYFMSRLYNGLNKNQVQESKLMRAQFMRLLNEKSLFEEANIDNDDYNDYVLKTLNSIDNQLIKKFAFNEINTAALQDVNLPWFKMDISFQLLSPYISKDDTVFYVNDNPIKKDVVFKLPYISPSSMKGYLRNAAYYYLNEKFSYSSISQDEKINYLMLILLLFGNYHGESNILSVPYGLAKNDKILEKGFKDRIKEYFDTEDTENLALLRGRLVITPTFFDEGKGNLIKYEVLNPHIRNRRDGSGSVPIIFEAVREGSTGKFSLLYFPYNISSKLTEEEKIYESDQMFKMINVFLDYLKKLGIGSKRKSGYGKINIISLETEKAVKWQLNLNPKNEVVQ
ncbi:RAMP superfamily CRISPR-associated protein [Calorimonas adulescens]|uniref:CRISPR type III-associated protein domain-containing protein n=1 Tax=Calorimonas adulescens TaxID=2606906 RepID=A0A5D8Q8F5_9THEO|nr:RAMP superfamily CRISPR-associated protein [Calorimonas adulescens]TZE80657.1 hypothetical protein FWJ32_12675 [Calorimonas adulescens]